MVVSPILNIEAIGHDQNCSVKQEVAAAASSLTLPCTNISSTTPKRTEPVQMSQSESPKSDFGCREIGKHWGNFMIPFCVEKETPSVSQFIGHAKKTSQIYDYTLLANRTAIVGVYGQTNNLKITTSPIVMIHIASGSEEYDEALKVYCPRYINLITRNGSIYWGSGACVNTESANETFKIYRQMRREGKVLVCF